MASKKLSQSVIISNLESIRAFLSGKMAIIQEYLTTEISLTQKVKKYHIGWTTIPK